LVRLDLVECADDVGHLGEVEIDDLDLAGDVQLCQPGADAARRAARPADDAVSLFQQELPEISAVLAGDAGDQRRARHMLGRASRNGVAFSNASATRNRAAS